MKWFATVLLCLTCVGAAAESGPLVIRITQGVEGALPIAIVPFEWTGAPMPEDISQIIANDLTRSGRFKPMPRTDLPSRPTDFAQVNFKDWRTVGMDNLVVGRINATGDGAYTVEFRLLDVFSGTQLAGFQIPASNANLRLTAHQISDIIYKTLLNVPGAFSTRIAYVTVNRLDAKRSTYRLQIADADGYDAKTVLDSKQPLLSPAWSPDGNRLAYVSFEDRNSAVYVQDVRSGQRQKVVSGAGINSAPAFSPDGTLLMWTASRGGDSGGRAATSQLWVSQIDAAAAQAIGTACTRADERTAAAFGLAQNAATRFEPATDLVLGGVLCGLPALCANGLFSGLGRHLGLPKGYYSALHILCVLGFMALARIRRPEQLRHHPPGELGKTVGLDRVPEVRTLREKIARMAATGNPAQWMRDLSKTWMENDPAEAAYLYLDGHVRVYHGSDAKLPRRYVSRQKLCLRGTTDYWLNDALGRPFFVISKAVTEGLDAWAWDAPPRYLVGYGMDDAGKMRGLPFVGAIKGA